MLSRKYDPALPYRFLQYGRMSSHSQNSRSPDQQFDNIAEVQRRCGYPWTLVKGYRDDGISGRFLKKRPQFQGMLRDIEIGLVKVDLIAVDSLERLGRSEEIAELRRKLCADHGVLVVTADTSFADPTGPTGKALGMVENIRSTEDGRIKAHGVVRGKKDTAKLLKWPGGPPPLGFKLKPIVNESVSPPEVYSILEPIPAQIASVQLAFQQAAETGYGGQRLAKWWNACPDIPADMKPMSLHTMAYVLSNEIYVGKLVWGANVTGIVNDTRVVEPNPNGPHVVVPGFCAPVIDPELFQRVKNMREVRSADSSARRAKTAGDGPVKLISPQARGLTLKYLLTGLVRCGCCGSSMQPVSSRQTTPTGKHYGYTHYRCPRAGTGACDNGRYVREDHLREAVIGRLQLRLFPPPNEPRKVPDWFHEVVALVQQELERYQAAEPDRATVRKAELQQLREQLAGWCMSLGDPRLPSSLRTDLAARYDAAKAREVELEAQIEGDRALENHLCRTLDPLAVIEELHQLGDVLAGHNPTLGNLELSRHIEHIRCFPDGRVEMRGTWLGVLGGAEELLTRTEHAPSNQPAGSYPSVNPRKRGRLRLPNLSAEAAEATSGDTCLDPERFAGLADSFFWSESMMLERPKSWSEANASEVARLRSDGLTHEQLAARFEVSVPTIRKALHIAAKANPSANALPRKMPRARWQDSNFIEVYRLKSEGWSVQRMAAHFNVSEPLIRAALEIAASHPTSTSQPVELPPPAEPNGE